MFGRGPLLFARTAVTGTSDRTRAQKMAALGEGVGVSLPANASFVLLRACHGANASALSMHFPAPVQL